MYKLIQKVGDYHVLTSIQNHINRYNNQSKLIKNKTNKKHQEIYDRGCLYKDKTMKYPTIKSYNTVFKISDNVNVKDILNLFYTDKELRKKSVLPRPKIIRNYKTYQQSGGNRFRHLVASDPRRYVLTNTDNSYVIKIARHKDYTCAYEDEAKIYDKLGNKDDIVKKYGSGKIESNLELTINDRKITIQKEELQLTNIIENAQYIILENTMNYGYVDFYDYINNLDNDKNETIVKVFKVFHEIMKTIKKYNTNYGFFHGDLHGHNVKVLVNDSQEIKVKLFDFDFSGIIKNQSDSTISRNITIYNLKKDQNLIFSCNDLSQNICECKTTFNIDDGVITDIKKFMYQFDYFRLLLSTIIHLENIFENEKGESVVTIIKENINEQQEDIEIFNKIIKWYTTNVIPKWSFCFKKDYFCTNIWETPPERVEFEKIQNNVKQEDLANHLDRLRLNRSSGDLSSNFSSMLSSQTGGKKSNTTMKKKLKKKY